MAGGVVGGVDSEEYARDEEGSAAPSLLREMCAAALRGVEGVCRSSDDAVDFVEKVAGAAGTASWRSEEGELRVTARTATRQHCVQSIMKTDFEKSKRVRARVRV